MRSAEGFLSSPSLPFRLSGESADGSGVVPQDESRPRFDIDEIEGEALVFNEVWAGTSLRPPAFSGYEVVLVL